MIIKVFTNDDQCALVYDFKLVASRAHSSRAICQVPEQCLYMVSHSSNCTKKMFQEVFILYLKATCTVPPRALAGAQQTVRSKSTTNVEGIYVLV